MFRQAALINTLVWTVNLLLMSTAGRWLKFSQPVQSAGPVFPGVVFFVVHIVTFVVSALLLAFGLFNLLRLGLTRKTFGARGLAAAILIAAIPLLVQGVLDIKPVESRGMSPTYEKISSLN